MTTTLGNIAGLNTDTQKVINYMSGRRTAEQIVGEYFGLRKEAVYDDNGENIVDYVNDFKDIRTLEKKKVQYNERLKSIGVTEEQFNGLFQELPDPANFKVKPVKKEIIINSIENGNTNGGEQNNTGNTGKTKKK